MKERDIQEAVVGWLDRQGYMVRVGLEGAKRTAAQIASLKRQGLKAGWPDLEIYLPDGFVVFIELKGWRTPVTENQQEVMDALKALGHEVHIVRARDRVDALEKIEAILKG